MKPKRKNEVFFEGLTGHLQTVQELGDLVKLEYYVIAKILTTSMDGSKTEAGVTTTIYQISNFSPTKSIMNTIGLEQNIANHQTLAKTINYSAI